MKILNVHILIQLILNESLFMGYNNEICYQQKKKIKCIKNDILFLDLKDNNQSNLIFQGDKICLQNFQKFFCQEINNNGKNKESIFESKNQKVISGKNQLCMLNQNIIDCDGHYDIKKTVKTTLSGFKNISYLFLRSGENNFCMYLYKNKFVFKCLGDESTKINNVPLNITDTFNNSVLITFDIIVDQSIGFDTACILFKENQKTHSMCWGTCFTDECAIPEEIKDISDSVISFKVGQDHACIIHVSLDLELDNINNVKCFGSNTKGQLNVPDSHIFQEIVTGRQMTCGLKFNSEMICWGELNRKYQLNSDVKEIETGGRHTCMVRGASQQCWGNGEQGQLELGHGDIVQNESSALAAGWDQTCLLSEKGLECTGFNLRGQTDVPKELAGIQKLEVKAGLSHSCAIQERNLLHHNFSNLVCWGGSNEQGQIDISHVNYFIGLISVGHDFTCLAKFRQQDIDISNLNKDQLKIICFGNNDQGQTDLVPIKYSDQFILTAGGAHGCALDQSNKANCWGSNLQGQKDIPQAANDHIYTLAAGDAQTCASVSNLFETSEIICWGEWVLTDNRQKVRSLVVNYENYCITDANMDGYCFGSNEWDQCEIPKFDFRVIVVHQ